MGASCLVAFQRGAASERLLNTLACRDVTQDRGRGAGSPGQWPPSRAAKIEPLQSSKEAPDHHRGTASLHLGQRARQRWQQQENRSSCCYSARGRSAPAIQTTRGSKESFFSACPYPASRHRGCSGIAEQERRRRASEAQSIQHCQGNVTKNMGQKTQFWFQSELGQDGVLG